MTPTPMDYSRLLRRMADRGMTQTELAKAAGIKPERMKQKLNSLLYFTLNEIRRICEALEIPATDTSINAYFYTPKGDEKIPEIETSNENRGGAEMRVYSKICKNHPKIKPLAETLITAAAQQGASIVELQYASEIALNAYKAATSTASCVELQSAAESILNGI